MAGRVDRLERQPLDRQPVAVAESHRNDVGLGLLAHHGDAARPVAQRAEAGDVIGVEVGIDRLDELQLEFPDELEIAIDFLQHGIDDQSLASSPAREQIGVGSGYGIEQLAKDQGCPPDAMALAFLLLLHSREKITASRICKASQVERVALSHSAITNASPVSRSSSRANCGRPLASLPTAWVRSASAPVVRRRNADLRRRGIARLQVRPAAGATHRVPHRQTFRRRRRGGRWRSDERRVSTSPRASSARRA